MTFQVYFKNLIEIGYVVNSTLNIEYVYCHFIHKISTKIVCNLTGLSGLSSPTSTQVSDQTTDPTTIETNDFSSRRENVISEQTTSIDEDSGTTNIQSEHFTTVISIDDIIEEVSTSAVDFTSVATFESTSIGKDDNHRTKGHFSIS